MPAAEGKVALVSQIHHFPCRRRTKTETYRVEVTLSRRDIGFSSIAKRRRYCWGGEMRVGSLSWIDGFASAAVPGVCALSLSITVTAARLSLPAFSFIWPSPHPLLLCVPCHSAEKNAISEGEGGKLNLGDATMPNSVHDGHERLYCKTHQHQQQQHSQIIAHQGGTDSPHL